MRIHTKRLFLWIFLLIVIGFLAFFGIELQDREPIIRTFDDCVIAGKRVIESIPRRCEISEGQFIVDIKGVTRGDVGEIGTCSAYVFENYKVDDFLKGVAVVDYRTYPGEKKEELSSDVKSVIEKEVAKGSNFSGYYIVPSWSCGSLCQESAIIDGRTGKILIFGFASQYGVEIKKDSKLFVVNPKKNIPPESEMGSGEHEALTRSYYVLENDRFNLLCREYVYKK